MDTLMEDHFFKLSNQHHPHFSLLHMCTRNDCTLGKSLLFFFINAITFKKIFKHGKIRNNFIINLFIQFTYFFIKEFISVG